MKLTHSQISEILSNYTSSSEGFVILQSLIMNSLMFHERELFISENGNEQCNGFRSRRWHSHGFAALTAGSRSPICPGVAVRTLSCGSAVPCPRIT